MKKLLIIVAVLATLLPASVFAARTDALWDYLTGANDIQPNANSTGVNILVVGSNHYINFNTLVGVNGYGFRDNGGIMEFKNSGGSWTGIGSGGSGTPGGSSGQLQYNASGSFGGTSTTTASCAGTNSCTPFTVIGSSPVTITGSASGGSGTVSTSSPESSGFLAYWTSTNGTPALLGKVATTSGTCTNGVNCTAVPYVGAVNPAFSLDQAFGAVWTAASSTYTQHISLNTSSSTQLTAGTFWDTAITSALSLFDSNHKETAYTGSSNPCSANQAPTTLTASGALGGCTSTFVTALGNYATTTSSAISLSTSTVTVSGLTYGLTIGVSGSGILFTPTVTGTYNGQAGSVANAVTFNNGGAGAASGQTYNGSSAQTISYNTIGAVPTGTTITVAGTSNQITSSAGAQDLSTNRTWTLSLPNLVVFPVAASSTRFSNVGTAYFGGSSTTTINSAGSIVFPSAASITHTGVSDGCGTWASGVLGSTGVACGSGGGGSGTVNTGTAGQVAFYAANGTAVNGTSTISFSSDANVLTLVNDTANNKNVYIGDSSFAHPVAEFDIRNLQNFGSFYMQGNNDGGDITITTSAHEDSGTFFIMEDNTWGSSIRLGQDGITGTGDIFVQTSSTTKGAFLDFSQIASSDKTFHFPNKTGTTTLLDSRGLGLVQYDNATTSELTATSSVWLTGITASRPLYVDSAGKVGSAGSGVSGNCVNWQASNTFGDAGAPCGAGSGITALGNYATTTGSTISLSTSTVTTNGQTLGVTIGVSANGILFTPTISGTLNNAGLTNSTISGVALGGTLAAHSVGASLTGTSYTGTASVSDWNLNMANSNWWTARQNFTNATSSGLEATSTNVFFDGYTSALLTVNASHQLTAYAGSNPCTNQVALSLSALGVVGCTSVTNAMLSNSTISGVALGGTLASHSVGSSLTGTAYTGTAAVSDWNLNMANSNWWTARQNFTNATSSGLEATSTNVFFDGYTSAMLTVNASHQLTAYAGSNPCTNQVALSLSALGVVGCTSITDAMFSGQLALSHGGTGAALSGANQVTYLNSANTAQTNDTLFSRLGTQGALLLGTTTAATGVFTVGSSTAPQIMLSDNAAADNMWTFRNAGGNLFVATSTATATSSVPAFSLSASSFLATLNLPTLIKSTSATAFVVQDGFGTSVFSVNTASTTGPIFQVQATSTTDTLFQVDQYGHLTASSTRASPTLSTCGTTPILGASANDVTGTITTGSGSPTACTVTFASPYSSTPGVVVSTNSSTITGGVTAVSTTAFTVTFSAALSSGNFTYIVVTP